MVGRILLSMLMAGRLMAADPVALLAARTNSPQTAVTNKPTSDDSFVLKRGFKLELVATDPVVANPIAMTFDEDGRLFVLETMENAPPGDVQAGRLRLLEDTTGSGIFDASSQYADGITNPLALACYGGGVFVSSAGNIIYLKDTKHSGVADVRQDVFKSFGDQANGVGGRVNINSILWGLDNRIHAATPGRGGDVISSSSPAQSVILTNGNFAFDPRTMKLIAESGSGGSGMCFDNRGRKFVCDPAQHIEMVMYQNNYAGRNPFYKMPNPVVDLSSNGPASLIYPASLISSMVAYGHVVPVAARFTAAAAVTIYRGDVFPADYISDAFSIDTVANVVHHDKLRPQGISMVAERPADETNSEFLSVRDNSFQPRALINGPDGALYLAGVIREGLTPAAPGKINAAGSVPSARGRIYRIAPINFARIKPSPMTEATGEQLVRLLQHPNGWKRDTAARLLYERQDKTTVAPLVQTLFDLKTAPLARMHALHALDGLQVTAQGRPGSALAAAYPLKALFDTDERVREHGVLLSERFMNGPASVPEQLWGQLSSMTGDPSPLVRYQLAFTLGQAHHDGRLEALAAILRRDIASPWTQSAALSSSKDNAAEMLDLLLADGTLRTTANGQEFLCQLAGIIGARNQPSEAALVLRDIQRLPEPQLTFSLVASLDNALQRENSFLATADVGGVVRALYARASRVALDDRADDAARISALQILSATGSQEPGVGNGLIWGWSSRRPAFRSAAVVTMLSRPERTSLLLNALASGVVPQSDLTSTQRRFLLAHPDANLRQIAIGIVGVQNEAQRRGVRNQYLRSSEAPGNSTHGRQVFLARCAACHQYVGEGNASGLAFAASAKAAKQALLTKIIDPNRDISANNGETLITTHDGETLTGFVTEQTAKSVTLCEDNGMNRVVSRSKIQYQGSLGYSAMPDGLEAGLTLQDMADLLEYLTVTAIP